MSRVLELTSELTSRASVTPDDAGCQRLISERLECRWASERRVVSMCGDVSNVLFTRGEGSASLWFLGHTDVVPTGPGGTVDLCCRFNPKSVTANCTAAAWPT